MNDPGPPVECAECGYRLHDGLADHESCTECGYSVRLSRISRQTMTRRDLAVLGCRLVALGSGIWYLVPAFREWTWIALWAAQDWSDNAFAIAWSGLLTTLHLALILLVWVRAPWLGRKIFPTDAGVRAPLNGLSLARVGLFLLGLYFVVIGASQLMMLVVWGLGGETVSWAFGRAEHDAIDPAWISATVQAVAGGILTRQPRWLLRGVRSRL